MTQKVLKVGSSAAVTIPKKWLDELEWEIGDNVIVEIDKKKGGLSVFPKRAMSKEDAKIAKLTLNFINRYRQDLDNLAKR